MPLAADDDKRRLGQRFRVLRELGSGSFGSVYEAVDEHTGERVALKDIGEGAPGQIESLKQELRALHDRRHPHVVAVRELIHRNGRWALVMDLVDGTQLTQWVQGNPADTHHADLSSRVVQQGGPARRLELERVRIAIAQLANALEWLHGEGLVHCDLKPDNVRVTPRGRVVLIDFGFARALASSGAASQSVGGTARYMAPEQAYGGVIGPAADWYALGVILYELLSGKPPFTGDAFEVMQQKQLLSPPPVSHSAPQIPAELGRLCERLLRREPTERAGAADVRAAVAMNQVECPETGETLAPASAPFRGRLEELTVLADAAHPDAGLRVVVVEGPAGIGKTALLECHLELDAKKRATPRLVLRGRCYEREDTPFKGVDELVSALGRHLDESQRLGSPLSTEGCEAATGLFPGLCGTGAFPKWPPNVAGNPATARRHGADAVIELLARVAARQPVALVVEDLQWSDGETQWLLRVLAEASARLQGVALLLTCRPDADLGQEVSRALQSVRQYAHCSEVRLGGLSREATEQVVQDVLGAQVDGRWLRRIVEQTEGHPMFASQLALHVEREGSSGAPSLTLDGVLAEGLRGISDLERKVVEVLSLSGAETPSFLADVVGAEHIEVVRSLGSLRQAAVVASTVGGRVRFAHQRVAELVRRQADTAKQKAWHASIASVLAKQSEPEPTRLGEHWAAAGNVHEALRWLPVAAQRAEQVLAFERAAQLYSRCLQLLPEGPETGELRSQWRERLGRALSHAGRAGMAARVFLEAAAEVEGARSLSLRVLAAQQLLQGAQVAEGLAAASRVLGAVNFTMPSDDRRALWSLLADRVRIGVIRSPTNINAARTLSGPERQRLDTLWALSMPLGWAAPLAGAAVNTRHVRLALRCGDGPHAVRALAQEAAFRAMQSPRSPQRYAPLLARAEEAAEDLDDPAARAFVGFMSATAAVFRWELTPARTRLTQVERWCIERCPDDAWLLSNVRMLLSSVWFHAGNHAELRSKVPRWISEANERADLFAATALTANGMGVVAPLMAGRADEAVACLERAMAPWPLEPYGFAHWGAFLASTVIRLYQGGSRAIDAIEHNRKVISRSFMMKTRLGGTMFHACLAPALLAHVATVSDGRRRGALRRVKRSARALGRSDDPFARASADLLLAQVAAAQGDDDGGRRLASVAEQAFVEIGHHFSHAAAWLAGTLQGGGAGQLRCANALEYYHGQGWVVPEKAVASVVPLMGMLEPS